MADQTRSISPQNSPRTPFRAGVTARWNPGRPRTTDPLRRLILFLARSNDPSPVRVLALALVPHIVFFAAAVWVSVLYVGQGANFLPIVDPRELPLAVFVYLIFVPVVWVFYVWQPVGIRRMLEELIVTFVPDKDGRWRKLQEQYRDVIGDGYQGTHYPWVALVTIAVAAFLWYYGSEAPTNRFFPQLPVEWYQYDRAIYAAWVLIVGLCVYMVTSALLRQYRLATHIRAFYGNGALPSDDAGSGALGLVGDSSAVDLSRAQVFHPDGRNGFAPVGAYLQRCALVVMLSGLWVAYFIFYPVLFAESTTTAYLERANTTPVSLFALAVYVVATGLMLVPISWETHVAMAKARAVKLNPISAKLERMVAQSGGLGAGQTMEVIGQLQQEHKLVSEQFGLWPFRPRILSGFSIAALLPLIASIVSTVLDIAKAFSSGK